LTEESKGQWKAKFRKGLKSAGSFNALTKKGAPSAQDIVNIGWRKGPGCYFKLGRKKTKAKQSEGETGGQASRERSKTAGDLGYVGSAVSLPKWDDPNLRYGLEKRRRDHEANHRKAQTSGASGSDRSSAFDAHSLEFSTIWLHEKTARDIINDHTVTDSELYEVREICPLAEAMLTIWLIWLRA
jgi:hypothetical protein